MVLPDGDRAMTGIERKHKTTDTPGNRRETNPLPLTQVVANQLRDMIVEDKLKPGEWIREQDLATQLKVSRTPLREALKLLDLEGLIRLYPNRGAVVTELTVDDVKQKLEVLAALESLAGRLACQMATEEEIAEIQALHYEMCAAFSRKNRLEYFKLNQQIHTAIVATTGNKTLIETHNRINAQLYRVRFQSNQQNSLWDTAINEHEEMLKGSINRNNEALSTAMQNHLGQTFLKFSKNLEFVDQNNDSVSPGL
jgi:DNA-binding GntR family transcriptional regulator